MSLRQFLVVHAGSRDNYQLAIALVEANRLKYLVTDDFFLRKSTPEVLRGKVKISYPALLCTLVNKFLPSKKLNRAKDVSLSRTSLQLAKKYNNLGMVAYSYYSNFAFIRFSGIKVLFQVHPHPRSVLSILCEEMSKNKLAANSIQQENEFSLSEKQLEQESLDVKLATKIIVASSFTKQTIVDNGGDISKIIVTPYGVDSKAFVERSEYSRAAHSMRILFVGSWNQRKGLSYLAQAISALENKPSMNLSLTVIGRGILDKKLVTSFYLKNVAFKYNIGQKELVREYQSHDVFVFPSLCEGFGHVILEAMSCGCPVITTSNTAGPDLITHGEEGYIIQPGDASAISGRLMELYNDPKKNLAMGKKAAVKAKHYSWANFRNQINKIIDTCEQV